MTALDQQTIQDRAEIELTPGKDSEHQLSILAKKGYIIFTTTDVDYNFILARVNFQHPDDYGSARIGSLEWREVWYEYKEGTWRRAFLFENKSSQSVSFKATFRVLT